MSDFTHTYVIVLTYVIVICRYSFLQVNDTRLEKQSDALPGLAYYMEKGVKYHIKEFSNS
jgi:hypothetical protein